MIVTITRAAFGQWHGVLTSDGDVVYDTRGSRPGCVARDVLNWLSLNVMPAQSSVIMEVVKYE